MIDIPIKAKVQCTDGSCGESVTVILDPVARKVTHFVVEDQDLVERVVPMDQVLETSHDSIYLRCSREELAQMEPFVEKHFIKNEEPDPSYYADHYVYMLPYATPMQLTAIPVEVEHIPAGEIAVRRGTLVEASDGYVGKVGELLVDPVSGRITHLVLEEGHLWQKKEVTLPLSVIDRVEEDTIYLQLDKKGIGSLPSIPVRRHYGILWPWKEVELFAKVYEKPEKASEDLELVTYLHHENAINVLATAVLDKGEDGKTSLKETGDLDAQGGRLFGAITGGLIGLLGGPVGAVLGALAGAGTGGVAAKWLDMGFSDDFLRGLQEHLRPGTSALLVLLEHEWAVRLAEALAEEEGVVLQQTLTDALVEKLLAGSEAEE